jgi:hypothetical protein
MQTTLDTVTDYITDARTLLQDVIEPYRYDDPSLVTALNVTLLEGRRLRADLFVFCRDTKGQVPSFSGNANQPVPIEPPFRLAFLHGLVGHALERDQEDIQDARAATYLKIFNDILLGVRPSSIAPAAGNQP